ncbi:MAG: SWIM zinc finger family protein [Rhodanobacter sp.]
MDRMEFDVQGSEPESYRVTLEKDGDNLNAYCTCAAGANGQYCKHRFRIFSGNPEGIIDPNFEALCSAVDWLVGTDVEAALSDLAKAEDRYEMAKKNLSKTKKLLAQAMLK